MVIGCCDSRVSPEVIFDAGPGELFVVRNVANLVPVYQPDGGAHGVSAALEYAVQVLRVKHIVVLGHAQCGGIRAFVDEIEPLSPGDFIGRWMAMFVKPGEVVEQREHESMQDFIIADREGRDLSQPRKPDDVSVRAHAGRDAARCNLHGAYFGVAEGSLFVLDPAAKEFERAGRSGEHAELRQARDSSLHRANRYSAFANDDHAAFFFALISLRLIRHSAIWIAFSAAPLRRLSDTHHSDEAVLDRRDPRGCG